MQERFFCLRLLNARMGVFQARLIAASAGAVAVTDVHMCFPEDLQKHKCTTRPDANVDNEFSEMHDRWHVHPGSSQNWHFTYTH